MSGTALDVICCVILARMSGDTGPGLGSTEPQRTLVLAKVA